MPEARRCQYYDSRISWRYTLSVNEGPSVQMSFDRSLADAIGHGPKTFEDRK